MHPGGDFLRAPELGLAEWTAVLRSVAGRYNPKDIDAKAFAGRARVRSICGFAALDLESNAHRVTRTHRDIRLDGIEDYYAIFQVVGASTMTQGDQVVELAVGDAVLVDSARPMAQFFRSNRHQILALQLPRRPLVSHLGFNPQGCLRGRAGTRAGRLLHQLILNAAEDEDSIPAPANAYMRLVVYDLVGALFAPSDPSPVSLHVDKLFRRVCDIIMDRFADAAFGPSEAAAEAGISLRYLQKLFLAHNCTCTNFINSVRLNYAARLLRRQTLLDTHQPVSEIAYACGFSDYSYFARKFRGQFGRPPGSYRQSI